MANQITRLSYRATAPRLNFSLPLSFFGSPFFRCVEFTMIDNLYCDTALTFKPANCLVIDRRGRGTPAPDDGLPNPGTRFAAEAAEPLPVISYTIHPCQSGLFSARCQRMPCLHWLFYPHRGANLWKLTPSRDRDSALEVHYQSWNLHVRKRWYIISSISPITSP